MIQLKEKNDFKRRLHDALTEFDRQSGRDALPDYVGAQQADPLEYVTRRFVIDQMLSALGWNIARMNLEMIKEARARGQTTLFLDYLGVNPDSRIPLVIVEAKAWAKPFISASAIGADEQGQRNTSSPAALVAAAIQHCKSGTPHGQSPVTAEWAEWIATLLKYVKSIHDQSGHVVSRVAISSGQWLVVFTDPETIFLKPGEVPSGAIQVFVGPEIIEESDALRPARAK